MKTKEDVMRVRMTSEGVLERSKRGNEENEDEKSTSPEQKDRRRGGGEKEGRESE